MSIARQLLVSLPAPFTQQVVAVEFVEPIKRIWKSEFYRIGLSEEGLRDGEQEYFQAGLMQPRATMPGTACGPRVCRMCVRQMAQHPRDHKYWGCQNAACQNFAVKVDCGLVRGVVRVGTRLRCDGRLTKNYDVDGDREHEFINGVLLTLDRRYNERTRVDVHKAACEVSGEYGWLIK